MNVSERYDRDLGPPQHVLDATQGLLEHRLANKIDRAPCWHKFSLIAARASAISSADVFRLDQTMEALHTRLQVGTDLLQEPDDLLPTAAEAEIEAGLPHVITALACRM